MTTAVDYRVIEPSRLVVAARSEIQATLRYENGTEFYFLEDSIRGKYFRLGAPEFAIFSALDGVRTLAEVTADAAGSLGSQAFTVEQVVGLAKWLVDAGLASTAATTVADRFENDDRQRTAARCRRWTPWFIRFSCGSPEAWLTRLQPVGDVLFRRDFFAVWCCLIVWALGIVVSSSREMFSTTPIQLGPRGALQLLAAWCLLKLIHETAHGLACRHFGGRVGAWGIAFVMGMPSPFIEVSSTWRFPQKYRRIIVSLAGVYAELLVAAAAVLTWSVTDDGVLRQTALAVAAISGVATLLFNLNPLMRFDGYFALSDWFEQPNLATAANDEVGRLLRRYFLGVEASPARVGAQHKWLVGYGLAAIAWRWFVFVGLLLLCLSRFGGPVTLLFSLLPVSYAVAQVWHTWRRRRSAVGRETVNRRRLVATYGSIAMAIGCWIWFFDPRQVEFPAVVEYRPLTVVRAATPGFVEEVFLGDGDAVAPGAAILRLRNDELMAEVEQARNLVEQSLAKSRVHRQAGEVAKEQGEAARRRGLESKWQNLQQQQDALTIRSTASGRIVSRGLNRLVGSRVEKGEQLAVVGDESQKEVIAAVGQAEASLFESVPRQITVVLNGSRQPITASHLELEPRVDAVLLHPALSVEHGGPIPVIRREHTQSDGRPTTIAPEHAEPYFRLHGSLSAEEATGVRAGRTASLSIRTTWNGLIALQWACFQRRLAETLE